LKEYDAVQKVKRGVFYTPRPVVGFIVRSVDDVLRTEFHLTDGLASTATWGEVIAASAARGDARPITLPAGAALSDPFVRILDPATGTGTFLVECVDLIHKTMLARWQTEKRSKAEIRALWNTYVPEHLLPRLAGFELMMAPYAIAHVKLGLKLSDTGYTFGSDARAQIYLTNALEPAQDLDMQLAFMSEALAHEAKAANEAKKTRFTVVVGNPPYKGESANPSKDGKGRLTAAGRLIRHYFTVDGKPLGEANSKWVNNDYIKFLALAEKIVTESGLGILGYITSHSWLLGGPFRGVRASHTETYQKLWIVDCHGNIGRRERAADGSRDVGIFEIEEGTNITVGAKIDQPTQTYFQDLFGSLETKFAWCNHAKIHLDVAGRIFPKSDMYALQPPDNKISSVDESFPKVNVVFPQNSVGILTSQDELSIHFSKSELKSAMDAFVSLDLAAVQNERSKKTEPADWKIVLVDGAASLVEKSEARDWRVDWAQSDIRSHKAKLPIKQLLYRPFDVRWTVYTGKSRGFHCMPRPENMANMFLSNPLGLVSARSNKTGMADHFFVSTLITEAKVGESGTQSNLFPLWVRPQGSETHTLPNIAPNFTNRVAALTGLAWDDCVERPKQGALAGVIASMPTQTAMFANRPGRGEPGHSFGPRDLFDWIYAVLHSPAYRRRYADYLKSDFARVPLPGSAALFEALVPIGTDLVATHLLDAEHRFGPDRLPILADPKGIRLAGSGEARVTQFPTFQAGRVYISGTRWFEIIPEVAWNFHIGGYQPAQKWLKDRAAKGGKKASTGRVLTDEDILHYRRIIMALTRTVELVPKIDKIIEEHGGWPGAFRGMADEVAIKAEAAD
jgi:predicted helicase